MEHPAVADAAVIPKPDIDGGEIPKAFVVLRPGSAATPDELIAHCARQLAKFKVPKEIEFVESLPPIPAVNCRMPYCASATPVAV